MGYLLLIHTIFLLFLFILLTTDQTEATTFIAIPTMLSLRILSALLFLIFSVFLPFGSSLSFNFPSFNQSSLSLLALQGNSSLSDGILELTQNDIQGIGYSSGRVAYSEPLFLWDPETRELTNFTTHFSFNIVPTSSEYHSGDGLAFFLSPHPSQMPENSSGGALGLFNNESLFDSSENKLVAVEIDTFPNSWDPPYYHLGIDINSIRSVAVDECGSSIVGSQNSQATISYSASTQNLSVILTYSDSLDATIRTNISSVSHIVDLRDILPDSVAIGFSAATGFSTELHEIISWSFSSTLQAPSPAPVISSPPPERSPRAVPTSPIKDRKVNRKIRLLLGLVSGVGVAMVLSGVVWFILWWKMSKKHAKEHENVSIDSDEFKEGKGPKRFPFHELAIATNNFAEEGKLGEGGFGNVYKGFLDGEEVAIKRVSAVSKQGKKEYISEVKSISQLRHRNLVQLVGWCHEKGELLLAYKFMPNGSLDFHLHNERLFLTWPLRYKIANQLACALRYLHEEWEQCVVHRDVKPSNVMLDSAFNAKLGDFGLARLVDHETNSQSTTIIAGTPGYMAPEIFDMGKTTKEYDIYSFGVVALEIACCQKPKEFGKCRLVEFVWELYGKGMILEAADKRLQNAFVNEEMERLMVVGLWCAHPYPDLRPTMRQAINVLNFEAPLPDLPPEMPVPAASKGKCISGRAAVEGSSSGGNSASTGFAANSSNPSISSG